MLSYIQKHHGGHTDCFSSNFLYIISVYSLTVCKGGWETGCVGRVGPIKDSLLTCTAQVFKAVLPLFLCMWCSLLLSVDLRFMCAWVEVELSSS